MASAEPVSSVICLSASALVGVACGFTVKGETRSGQGHQPLGSLGLHALFLRCLQMPGAGCDSQQGLGRRCPQTRLATCSGAGLKVKCLLKCSRAGT